MSNVAGILDDFFVRSVEPESVLKTYSDQSNGLQLVVYPMRTDGRPSGKAFQWRGRINQKIRKIPLGPATMPTTMARTKAEAIRKAIDAGHDPYQEFLRAKTKKAKEKVVAAMSLTDVFKRYSAAKHRDWKPRTAAEYSRCYYEDVEPTLGDKPAASIDKHALATLINRKAVTAPIMANRLQSLLSAMFGWAASSRSGFLIEANPMMTVKKPAKAKSRDRYLDEQEVRWFLAACRDLRDHKEKGTREWARLAEALLRTGQRRSDFEALTVGEYNGTTVVLPPERHKSNERHLIVVHPSTAALLDAAEGQGSKVFGLTQSDETHIKRIRAKMEEIAEQPIPHWTIHDLRRTFTTHVADMVDDEERPVVTVDELRKVKGHKLTGAIAAYLRGDAERTKARVMRIWNERVDALAG